MSSSEVTVSTNQYMSFSPPGGAQPRTRRVADLTWHSLRRRFARTQVDVHHLEKGELMAIGGWRHIGTVENRYYRSGEDNMTGAIRRVTAARPAPADPTCGDDPDALAELAGLVESLPAERVADILTAVKLMRGRVP